VAGPLELSGASQCGPWGPAGAAPAKFRPAGGRGRLRAGVGWPRGAPDPIWGGGPGGRPPAAHSGGGRGGVFSGEVAAR
jgi:hypothetical protein